MIENLIVGAILTFIANILTGMANWCAGGYENILAQANTVLNSSYITQAMFAVQALALTVLAVRVGYEILHTYILHMSGDGTADPKGVLFRTAKAAVAIMGVPWLTKWIFQLTIALASDLSTVGGVSTNVGASVGSIATSLGVNVASGVSAPILIVVLLALIIFFVVYLVILLQMACRAVEIGLLAVAGPLMLIGFVSPSEGLGAVWWRELLVQCMAQPVQIFMLRGALLQFGTLALTSLTAVQNSFWQLLFVFGWLWVAYKSPKLLQQFAMSTGVGGAAAGVAGQVGSIAITKALL